MSIDRDIREAQKRISERQERLGKLEAARAKLDVPDLQAFEALSDKERRTLYDRAPDLCTDFYRKLADKRHHELVGD